MIYKQFINYAFKSIEAILDLEMAARYGRS